MLATYPLCLDRETSEALARFIDGSLRERVMRLRGEVCDRRLQDMAQLHFAGGNPMLLLCSRNLNK